jgi:hypothetical protein
MLAEQETEVLGLLSRERLALQSKQRVQNFLLQRRATHWLG